MESSRETTNAHPLRSRSPRHLGARRSVELTQGLENRGPHRHGPTVKGITYFVPLVGRFPALKGVSRFTDWQLRRHGTAGPGIRSRLFLPGGAAGCYGASGKCSFIYVWC